MAKFSFTFFIVVFLALLFVAQSGATFVEKQGEEEEVGKGSFLMKLLIEAETKTLGLAKDVLEFQTKDQLKCIPCGAACISSRNCCNNCYCLIMYELLIPRCIRKQPSNQLD